MPISIKEIATRIMQNDEHPQYFALDQGERLYRYQSGVYVPRAVDWIKNEIINVLDKMGQADQWKPSLADGVIRYISESRNITPFMMEVPNANIINLNNGLFNVKTRKLEEHKWSYLSPIRVNVVYDKSKTCPLTEKFLKSILPEDTLPVVWEILGWMLTSDMSIQKAVLLIGRGANGKSTFIEWLKMFIGTKNISFNSLNELEEDKFSVANLLGKLANICPDLPSRQLRDVTVFKRLTGGDSIEGQFKFGQQFGFKSFAKLVFSSNQHPFSDNQDEAFYRRWIVIPFNQTFTPGGNAKNREEILEELNSEDEKSGVLNQAIEGLYRLRKNHKFSETDEMVDALEEMNGGMTFFREWINRNLKEDQSSEIAKGVMYEMYIDECKENGKVKIPTDKWFGKMIKKFFSNTEDSRRNTSGKGGQMRKVYRVWQRLGWQNEAQMVEANTRLRAWAASAERSEL